MYSKLEKLGLYHSTTGITWEDGKKQQKASAMEIIAPAEIKTGCVPNTNAKC